MNSIPVARPVQSIKTQESIIAAPLAQPLISNEEPTFQICKTCRQLFHRKEDDKLTSRYFRCEDCIDKQVSRGILASCILQ